jgi:hypothetical protein
MKPNSKWMSMSGIVGAIAILSTAACGSNPSQGNGKDVTAEDPTSSASAALVLEKTTFKGKAAQAFVETVVPITCTDGSPGTLSANVSINGTEQSSSHQNPVNSVAVFAASFDSCTGTDTFAIGSIDNALKQNALQSATMVGTVPVADFNGNPVGTVTLNLTLDGTGNTSFGQMTNRFRSADGSITYTEHSQGSSRQATATGSVVFNGVETLDIVDMAQLLDSQSGTIEQTR